MTQPQEPSSRAINWLLGLVVVLVIVVVVLVFVVLGSRPLGGDSAGSTTTSTTTTSTTVAESTTSTSSETTSTTTTSSTTTTTEPATTTTTLAPNERAAVAAVTTWIDALSQGNADASWALVAPSSQEVIGGRDGYDAIFSGLVEGFGAWASGTDPFGAGTPWVFVNEIDDQILIVTLAGTVTQEGTTAVRAASIPVVVLGDVIAVQPFLRLDPIEWTDPAFAGDPWPVAPNGVVTMTVQGAPIVRGYLGSDDVGLFLDPGDGTSTVISAPLSGVETGGLSVLTVVLLDEEVLHADAVVIVATESS